MKILDLIKIGNLDAAKNGIYNRLSEIANYSLDIKKVEIAQSYFGQQNEEVAGWIAIYNGKKYEIRKDTAKDLYSAKLKAIEHFKIPKSKQGLLSVRPAYNEEIEISEASYDSNLNPNKPIIVSGVMGMSSKKFKKKFPNLAAYQKWSDGPEADNYEIRQVTNEETLDELSKKTLGSYIKKASHDVATRSAAVARYSERSNKALGDNNLAQAIKYSNISDRAFSKSWKRRQGIAKATDKLTKEDINIHEEMHSSPHRKDLERMGLKYTSAQSSHESSGFYNKNSNVKINDLHKHITGKGYRLIKKGHNWFSYQKPGTPYHEDEISVQSNDGKHAHLVHHRVIKDRT